MGVERMLRLHCLQKWLNLSDPAVEESLYDSRALRQFVGIDLGREPVPDEATICNFRHLLEAHQLGEWLFALIGEYLDANGVAGDLMAGEPRRDVPGPAQPIRVALADHPRNRLFSANVN